MTGFLVFLFLGLIVALIVGLIKPFRFYPGQPTPSRKKLGLVFGTLIILSFIGIGVTSPSPRTKVEGDSIAKSTPTQTPSANVQTLSTVTQVNQNQNTTLNLVTRVVDGDTIEIDGGTKVRLIGIDTPETVDPNRPVGCYGKEASDFTKSQLVGKQVRLEKDVSETDKYGRLLRYVWIGDSLFNKKLVEEGYAQVSTYPPDVKYQEIFLTAQTNARNGNKGLWVALCVATPTPKPVVAAPTSKPTTSAQTAVNSGSCKYSCISPDRDCSDFKDHSEAQTFFNCCGFSAGNDPMRLDKANGQGDGQACESL